MTAEPAPSWRLPTCATLGRALLAAAGVLASASVVAGQAAVQVQAGSSSLFGAHGGSVEARGRSFSLTLGAGSFHDQFTIGARLQKTHRGITFSFGDDTVDFQLPTDVFGVGRYLPIRGGGVALVRGGAQWRGFIGTTSTNVGAPFFRGAEWGRALGMLFVDIPRGPHWRIVSRNAFTNRPTSIQGVEWQPDQSFKLAASGGVGAGHPYFSSSAAIDRGWVLASAAYVTRDAGFRRIDATSPMASEVEGENVSVTIRPDARWSVSATRQNLVDSDPAGLESKRATVNQLAGNVNVAGTRLGAAVFDSHREQVRNLGISMSAGRRVNQLLDVAVDYFRSGGGGGGSSASVVGRVQEAINPRVSLLQVVTRNGDQTSFNMGGQFLSNVLTIGLGYQTAYAPFRAGSPFVQTLALDLRVQLFGFQLQGGTYVAPNGKLRYTVSGSHILSGSSADGRQGRPFKFAKYLVRGSVIDMDGLPVPGAVIRIGKEIVMTGDDGLFFLRMEKASQTTLTVLTGEFLIPGAFEVVSSPTSVKPALEQQASAVRIVVRRV